MAQYLNLIGPDIFYLS